jgi:hypothetical protein
VATAPTAAPPAPEPAAPVVETDKAASRGSGKPASSRARATRARHPSYPVAAMPAPFESTPAAEPESAPAAEPESAPAAEPESASVAEPMPRSEPEPPVSSKTAPVSEPAAPAPPKADDLVREAQQRRMRGHYAAAIGKAEAALEAEPTPAQAARAYEIIGMCACAIGDGRAAREAASHLGEAKRELVREACEKKGLPIE